MVFRCAVLDDYQHVAMGLGDWSRLAPRVEVTTFADHLVDDDALVSRLQGFECLVVMRERTPLPGSLIGRLPRLKLIVTSGMRNGSIDLDAAAAAEVTVCGTASSSAPPTELTWALILALRRSVVDEALSMRHAGPWQHTLGSDLEGQALGLIGLGKIGSRMARIGDAFGMRVAAWSPNLTTARAEDVGVRRSESLDELLSSSDVVSVHLQLGATTRGLVGRRELALMSPASIMVNTSRAAIVDQDALIQAVRDGTIAGAAVDVFDEEPLPADHPLRREPRIVATPHLGYVTEGNYRTYFTEAVDNISAYLDGQPVRVLAPPPRMEGPSA